MMAGEKDLKRYCRFYIAAQYENNGNVRLLAERLGGRGRGLTVTSTWAWGRDEEDHSLCKDGHIDENPLRFAGYAMRDLTDIDRAEALIFLSESDGSQSTGGRHTEFGYALGKKMPIIIIGGRENVFHTLPGVLHFPSPDEFFDWLDS